MTAALASRAALQQSSLIFQSLDAVRDVGLGVGTTLGGAAAWKKVTGGKPAEPAATPPPPPPASPQGEKPE